MPDQIEPVPAPVAKPMKSFYFSPSVAARFPGDRSRSYVNGKQFTEVVNLGASPSPTKANDVVKVCDGNLSDVTVKRPPFDA